MLRGSLAILAIVLGARVASAADVSIVSDDGSLSSWPSPATEMKKFADWNGLRSKLEQQGLKFTFTYYGDAFANPIGGVKQGAGYYGRFGTIIDGDLEKLVGWSGATFHASFHQIHETDFSGSNLDNLMTVSGIGIGYPVSTRLFNLWIEQKLSDQLSLLVGQYTAGQEFLVSKDANLFVNSTFGWPVLNALDLPSGGPAYPEATPGARIEFKPTNQVTLRAAIFDGNPAGPGSSPPVERDPFGVAFRLNDPPFFIAELAYAYGQKHPGGSDYNENQEGSSPTGAANLAASDMPGSVKIGAWVHTGSFDDELVSAGGGTLPLTGGPPLQHWGDYALYTVVDQTLWRPQSDSDRGLSFFARAVAAPSDRNLISAYLDGGFTFKGPLPFRPDDRVGFGLAYAALSPELSAADEEVIAITGKPMPVRDYEAAIELTYRWKLASKWFLQPDLQYIIHPGGNIPNPTNSAGTSPIPNALVLGMRTSMRF